MFNFVMKKMMQKQLKNLPKDQADKLMAAFEKDPKFFQDIAKQIQKKVKAGANQQNASMQVMMENRERLQELMK
jgi:mRNA-degrading endonuclease RelE of RelBE toxin-antitoxin system